jgi:hypothetical protein
VGKSKSIFGERKRIAHRARNRDNKRDKAREKDKGELDIKRCRT